MPLTSISQSNDLSLNEVIARLELDDAVDGILLVGSTGQDTLSPASDYDLVVVLSAMRWLAQHDRDYLNLFHAFLDATHRNDKLAIYEQLVPLTIAPVGPVWSDRESAVQFSGGSAFEPEMIDRGLAMWESLLNEPKGASGSS